MSDELKELATEFSKATEKVKGLGEELTGRMEKGEQNLEQYKGDVDEALTSMNDIKSRLTDVEQKQARRGGADEDNQKSLAQQLIDSDRYKEFVQDPRSVKSAKITVKSFVNSNTTNADGSAGALVNPHRVQGIIAPPEQRLQIRDLLAYGTTDSNAIEFVKETGFTNNAQPQAEGEVKGESSITFSDETNPVRTIAHFIKVSRQILDDAPQLESHINARLMYGLKLKEDAQLLNGDGKGSNLKGIIPQATAFANPTSIAQYTIIDQLRLAMLQAVLAEYPASGHVLNPIDWATIELEKDTTGRHIIGQPQGKANPTLWNLPVVATQSMQASKFLTGAFSLGGQVFDREQSSLAVATENEDDFIRNKVTILCEERLALAVYRPECFIYGDLQAKGKK